MQEAYNECVDFFSNTVSQYATVSEKNAFNNLARTAKRYVNDPDFERHISELWGKVCNVLSRQDWYIIAYFRARVQNPNDYRDRKRFEALKARGEMCIQNGDIDSLRRVIGELFDIMKNVSREDKQLSVNIIKG